MKCKGCGAEINREQLFCSYCGTKNEEGQAPMNQIYPGQMPTNQINPGQMPTNQINPGQMPTNQVNPGQLPTNQVNPGQIPSNQVNPGQMPPYHSRPYYNMYNQYPINRLPPPVPPHVYNEGKKKSKVLLIITVVVASIFMILYFLLIIFSIKLALDDQQVDGLSSIFEDGYYEEDGVLPGIGEPFLDSDNGDFFTEEESLNEFFNYSYYIEGRELIYFDIGDLIMMENGISFTFQEAIITDLGDGTAQIDCKFNVGTKLTDIYLYSDDFLLVPMDGSGNALLDAAMVTSIIDSDGNYLEMPYPIGILSDDSYTLSFLVPANTEAFTIYAINLSGGIGEAPVYCIDLVIE